MGPDRHEAFPARKGFVAADRSRCVSLGALFTSGGPCRRCQWKPAEAVMSRARGSRSPRKSSPDRARPACRLRYPRSGRRSLPPIDHMPSKVILMAWPNGCSSLWRFTLGVARHWLPLRSRYPAHGGWRRTSCTSRWRFWEMWKRKRSSGCGTALRSCECLHSACGYAECVWCDQGVQPSSGREWKRLMAA